jgi:hypothetical protein
MERKHPGGRPTKLTRKIIDDFIIALRAGNYLETAAAYVGVSKQTLFNWLRRGARGQEKICVEFLDSVKKAQAESEIRDIATIVAASKTTWQAAAWRLERKHPGRWGRKDTLRADIRAQRIDSKKRLERDKTFEDQITALMPHVAGRDENASGPEA